MMEVIAPGRRLARGVARLLRDSDFAALIEFAPAPGLRVDVIALGAQGEIWIVECKSCREDFAADRKWPGYLPWCDRFFFSVGPDFPAEILPLEAGLILADDYGGELARLPEPTPLAGARRKALVRRFARVAADRLALLTDPGFGAREAG